MNANSLALTVSVVGLILFSADWRKLDAAEAPTDAAASHARMLEELEIVRDQTADTNTYLGDARARMLREVVAKFGRETPAADRFDAHMQLGIAELNLGQERVAIDHFLSARETFASSGLPDGLKSECLYFLAVAYIRLGETENCCRQPSPESCLFPIQGGGVHTDKEGSTAAIAVLEEILRQQDLSPKLTSDSAWLLNLAHMTLGTWPDGVAPQWRIRLPEKEAGGAAFPRFPNVAADRGLGSFGLAGGVAADDFDGDGRIDLFVSCWDSKVAIRFFQQQPDGSFLDRSQKANLDGLFGGLNLLQADYDNDGDLDLLVLRGAYLGKAGRHPNSLLRNEGVGPDGVPHFVDVTHLVGLGDVPAPTQVAGWADYDLDGDLDLFLGNETAFGHQAACQLFRNDKGVFEDVSAASGVENFRLTKGCSWGDYDGDGDPDLYVSNLGGPNRLYRNQGDGSFIDVAKGLGVDGPDRSFPTWFWDFNNDGALDLFVSNYTTGGEAYWPYYRGEKLDDSAVAALYVGDGKGGFVNQVREAGLDAPMVPMGSNFGDLNNDGFPDIYLGTGTPNYADIVPNLLFMNEKGERFIDRTIESGTGHLQKGHGVAFADFDDDGDVDIFEQMGGAVPGDSYYDALFENPGSFATHWLKVRLRGTRSNSFGIGSRIRVVIEENGVERSVYAHVNSGGSFGANPLTQHLGLGKATSLKRLEVFWPATGETQIIDSPPFDQRIVITEGKPLWEKF